MKHAPKYTGYIGGAIPQWRNANHVLVRKVVGFNPDHVYTKPATLSLEKTLELQYKILLGQTIWEKECEKMQEDTQLPVTGNVEV